MNAIDIFILGVIGGVSPGPITALMLGETFKHGFKVGVKVPLALIFSNILIGGVSLGLFSLGKDMVVFLSLFTYVGAMVLIWMGVHEFKASGKLRFRTSSKPFQKALLIELGNVHPYVFWFGVLAPAIVLQIQVEGFSTILISWFAFALGLVATKLLIILLADLIRAHLKEVHILWINRVLAIALIFFGLKLMLQT